MLCCCVWYFVYKSLNVNIIIIFFNKWKRVGWRTYRIWTMFIINYMFIITHLYPPKWQYSLPLALGSYHLFGGFSFLPSFTYFMYKGFVCGKFNQKHIKYSLTNTIVDPEQFSFFYLNINVLLCNPLFHSPSSIHSKLLRHTPVKYYV